MNKEEDKEDDYYVISGTKMECLGMRVIGRSRMIIGSKNCDRVFRQHFGVSSHVASITWNLIDIESIDSKGQNPKYFLWTLLFMKLYSSEISLASLVGTSPKTFRKWTWTFIRAIERVYDCVVSLQTNIIVYVFLILLSPLLNQRLIST